LLFGSGAPARPIQAALNAVLSADLTEAERRAILAGNAARVFGLPLEPFDIPSATVATDLFDVHTHIGRFAFPTPRVEAYQHAATLARYGVARSVASSLRAIADDLEVGNQETYDVVGDDVAAYVVVNPNDLEASCRAMDAAYTRELAVGAKLHCGWSQQPTASRACAELLREVARRGRPLLIHVDGPDWSEPLYEVASAFPDWRVIVAHAGPGTPSLQAADLVERTSNVYVELPTSFPDRRIAGEVARRAGPGRLLFGSDAPLLDPAYVQGIYADAHADLTATAGAAREVFTR
jgi:predicted TIM-barrel fold metal-dependent hydrolase